MGNTCCEASNDQSFQDKINAYPVFNDYDKVQWPQNEQLNEWIKQTGNEDLKNQQIKKHKYEDKYYIGEWEEGQPSGKGIYYDPSNIIYDGQFSKGTFDGNAKVNLLKKNCIYEGNIVNGQAKGKGTIVNNEKKYKFDGEWDQSRPVIGIYEFNEDSNVLRIEIKDAEAKMSTIYYKDERIYEGSIDKENYLPDGIGKVKFSQKSSKRYYEGDWKQGQMHGKGTYVCKDDSRYEGEYFENRKEGHGKFYFTSGNIYDGEWKAGKQDGMGVLMDKLQRELKKGRWQNGKFMEEIKKSLIEEKGSNMEDQNIIQKRENETPQFSIFKEENSSPEKEKNEKFQEKPQQKQQKEEEVKKSQVQIQISKEQIADQNGIGSGKQLNSSKIEYPSVPDQKQKQDSKAEKPEEQGKNSATKLQEKKQGENKEELQIQSGKKMESENKIEDESHKKENENKEENKQQEREGIKNQTM